MRQLSSKGKMGKQAKSHIRKTAIRKNKRSSIGFRAKHVSAKQDFTEPTLSTADDHTEEHISIRKESPKGNIS